MNYTHGETNTIIAKVENTDDTRVIWKSSDEKIAVVDTNGNVTAKGKGETTITATTLDGSNLTENCKIEIWWSEPYENREIYNDGTYEVTIPKGFQVSLKNGETNIMDGLVVRKYTDKNEFVWIPVNLISGGYAGKDWGQGNAVSTYSEYYTSNTTENSQIIQEINTSVNTYNGYYIGRYEAGTLVKRTDGTQELTKVEMRPTSKEEPVYVYNFINWEQVIELSNNLYSKNVNDVQSRLINQRGWDTALKFIEQVDSSFPTDSLNKGWYTNNSVNNQNYEIGKSVDLSNNTVPNKIKNIYDMAGNVWEWNAEIYYKNTDIRPPRGGSQSDSYPASYRGGAFYYNPPSIDTGMRIAIYL